MVVNMYWDHYKILKWFNHSRFANSLQISIIFHHNHLTSQSTKCWIKLIMCVHISISVSCSLVVSNCKTKWKTQHIFLSINISVVLKFKRRVRRIINIFSICGQMTINFHLQTKLINTYWRILSTQLWSIEKNIRISDNGTF